MELINRVDPLWFEIGFNAGLGVQVPKRESANKVYNLGKQGVTLIPTNLQKASFTLGLYLSLGDYPSSWAQPNKVPYQDKDNRKSKGDWLSLEIKSIETTKGATINLPFYICNNAIDNRGYAAYQYKIKYPTQYLTFNSITPSSTWTGTFQYQHDAAGGIVLVQGVRDSICYEDAVFGSISFTVAENVPKEFKVYLQGPTGQGIATDLFTLINGELWYIQAQKPGNLTLVDGTIKILGEEDPDDPDTPSKPNSNPPLGENPTHIPPMGDEDDGFSPDTELEYEFDLGLHHVEGSGSGSGANLAIKVSFGDGTFVVVYIPLQEGSHKYKGKLPLRLPSLAKGPAQIEYWLEPEDEEDVFYYFIKAGALWNFYTEIPREEVGEVTPPEPKRKKYENMLFYEKVHFEFDEVVVPDGPVVSEVSVSDIMQFIDTFKGSTSENDSTDKGDSFIINEIVHFEFDYIPPVEVEDMGVSESLLFVDKQEVGFVEVKKMGEEDALIIREIIKIEIEE